MADKLASVTQDDLDHAHTVVGHRWKLLANGHVFLTGGTGFVGKWLLSTLLDADRRLSLGCRVTVLTRNPSAFVALAPHLAQARGVDLLEGDVRALESEPQAYTHVVHAATDASYDLPPTAMFDTCVQGTQRVLSLAARSHASVLLVSSGAVYGKQPPNLQAMNEDFAGTAEPLHTMPAYTVGKRASEWLAHAYAKENGLDIKTARCFAFVGPYLPLNKHYAVGNFLRDALAAQPVVIRGDGTPIRSYLYAADMAGWLWSILLGGQAGRTYNVGGSEAVSIQDLAKRVVSAAGTGSTIQTLKEAMPGALPERYVPDTTRAQQELALPPSMTLDAAIRRTAAWCRQGDLG